MDQSQRFVLVKAILPQKDMHYVSLINEQLKLQKKYPQYILAINGYDFFEDKTLLQITYNCSKYAKSLTEVQFKTQEEKFRIFDQLIEIAEFLEKNKILHNNIKKNNLIIDHNKLYLTDFGYIAGQPDLNIFRNKLNFINLNLNQKKQIYPYLTKGLMEAIITYNERQLKQKLEKREPIEIMQYDQHVLTSLMVEIFSPLEWNNCDLSYLKDFSFSQKIGYIKINNLDLQDYAIVIIEQILNFRFQKENQLTLEFPRRLEPMLKKIDKQRVLNNKNLELVEDYFKNKDFEFDLGLLYCFTTCKLLELETQVEQSGKEFDCKLRKEISRILAILNMIDNQIFQKKDFEKLESLDDKLFCLAYLDEQFETFEISKNRDQTQKIEKLLYNYSLKYQLIEFYDQINRESKDQFMVNQAFQKQYRNQLYIHPETFEQNEILKEYINIHIKIEIQFDINQDETIKKDTIIIKQRNKGDQTILHIKKNNEDEKIIHEVCVDHINYIKHLKVVKLNRHFQPTPTVVFKLIKKFKYYTPLVLLKKQKQLAELIDYNKKIKYKGECDFDEDNRDIIFQGKGIREILESDQTTLKIGDVYKVSGTFKNNILEGDQIKTFYYHFIENKRTFSIGKYKNEQLSGRHEHYLINQPNEYVKTIHHCSCCFCSPLQSCYYWRAWCAWCPCLFRYYWQII